MNKLFWVTILAIVTLVCTSMAFEMTDPAATSGNTTYSATDVFGTILGTIPSTSPGPSNAWVGMAYANGYIYQFKNIASPTSTALIQVNPTTGAIVNTYTLAFSGYVIGAQYDGTGIWVVQWSPTNMIHKVSLTGTTITSFAPGVAPYSARSLGWDGTNLLVGCNQSSNVTELAKYTPAGVMVGSPIASGSAVGWYMDGEVCADAPAGGNYYVVDNVGNTLKRLNVGVTVTVAQSVASPASSPDVAEGLAYNGDDLWHCGAYASAGVLWRLDDGYAGAIPTVDLTLVPLVSPIVIPANGGSFSFYAFAENTGSAPAIVSLWTRMRNPNGTYSTPLLGPLNVTLPPGTTGWFRNQSIPGSAPSGSYLYLGYLGAYPGVVYDSSSFPFTKSAVADNGPYVWDEICSGELLPGETAVAAPNGFSLAGVCPNPFNPTTNISYELRAASYVNLKVYDASGRFVGTLVEGMREAGTHEAAFDGSNLASGVYPYSLNAGGQMVTGKMMLLK
jgi:hypothetical protein